MRDKFSQWVTKVRNSHLQPGSGYAWVAYRLQLQIWPGIRYSLGTLTNDMEDIDIAELFQVQVRDIYVSHFATLVTCCPQLSEAVAYRSSSVWRCGLWHMPTKQLIERLTMLLQHYQRESSLGREFRAMARWLQLEIGTSLSPFEVPYDTWSPLATHCWHKMLRRTIQWSGLNYILTRYRFPFLVRMIFASWSMSFNGAVR